MQIEDKLETLNNKNNKYDYFLENDTIFVTIINKQDLEVETKTFFNYKDFVK